ncbi:MAG: adenylate/guanylate cyclase domain-containing protein [Polyangiaceae bacterium]
MVPPEATPPDVDARLFALNGLVDGLLERAARTRKSLAPTLRDVLDAVVVDVGVQAAFVHTLGEDHRPHTFGSSGFDSVANDLRALDTFLRSRASDFERSDGEAGVLPTTAAGVVRITDPSGHVLLTTTLDVAGEPFGVAGFVVHGTRNTGLDLAFAERALTTVCEELDNFLQTVRTAREKHRVMMQLSSALQHRVLSDGLGEAVRILARAVPFERLVVALRPEQNEGSAVHVQVYEQADDGTAPSSVGPVRTCDSMGDSLAHVDVAVLRDHARTYLESGNADGLKGALGITSTQEEVLIHGVRDATLVGKILVSTPEGGFATYDRELFASFASFICQRVVDFSREYRTLARSFRAADVERMLRRHDYVERYLVPREGTAAILFTDIAGFTRISEQVLVDPRRIGRLIDVWGARAVDILWEHGGVFDKMVGDCVIGLFGPPFFEEGAADTIDRALRAAVAIRTMTVALADDPEFSELRAEGLGVSTGVNYAPLFVGRFGPNENFTGFSSGMNNTARLQAQAHRNEILVMEETASLTERTLPAGRFRFGDVRSATVKNVAAPLVFRPLLDP